MRRFVSEDRALDAFLLGNGVVDVVTPNKHGVTLGGAQNDILAGTNELAALSSIGVMVSAVMSLVERETGFIAIFC